MELPMKIVTRKLTFTAYNQDGTVRTAPVLDSLGKPRLRDGKPVLKPVKIVRDDVRKIELEPSDISINPSTTRILAEENWTPKDINSACASGFFVAQDARLRDKFEREMGKKKAERAPKKALQVSDAEKDILEKLARTDNEDTKVLLSILARLGVVK